MPRYFPFVCVSLVVLAFTPAGMAQQPISTGNAPGALAEQAGMPAPAMPVTACQPCPPANMKVCVPEPKKNTKIVYDCQTKDFCQKSCWQLLREYFTGNCGCEATCGEVRTKTVLVKKVRSAPDTVQCVVKEVPCATTSCQPALPAGK